MKIACICWWGHSIGGIGTRLNTLRKAARLLGDELDILFSYAWKTKRIEIFPERKRVRAGGDAHIWIDGVLPHSNNNVKESCEYIKKNYDAILFGYLCPHPKNKKYPSPEFLPLFDVNLPKVAYISDGYWEEYKEWGELVVSKLNRVFCPVESYAAPVRESVEVEVLPFPFMPRTGKLQKKSSKPLVVWPNQWKGIKGITQFLRVVPSVTEFADVELYSTGISYFNLRKTDDWKRAVGEDKFDSRYSGNGKASYLGEVNFPEIEDAYCRAWYTVNLQGMTSRNKVYKRGSYNNTEVEAIYYGAIPILHSSVRGSDLPEEFYVAVNSAEEVESVLELGIIFNESRNEKRKSKARDFVLEKHYAPKIYKRVREFL